MASGEMSEVDFRSFLADTLGAAAHCSRDGAVHFVCMDWRHLDGVSAIGSTVYGELLNLCIWNKSNAGMGSLYRSNYLGIDTPPVAFHGPNGEPSKGSSSGKIDTAEFLSAVGTFLATLVGFVSVGVIVLREVPHISWTLIIVLGWVIGVMMHITAGTIARTRT